MTTSFEDKIKKLPTRIQKDIVNLYFAGEEAERYINFSKKKFHIPGNFFFMIHKILLGRKPSEAGIYRKAVKKLKIPKGTFEIPEAWEVRHRMVDLIELINNKRRWFGIFKKEFIDKNKSIQKFKKEDRRLFYGLFMAWYFHHQVTIIHPFSDGNGRTARILMCLILKKEGYINPSFPLFVNEVIRKYKAKYLDALNEADKGNYSSGVNYLIFVLVKSTAELNNFIKEKNEGL